MNTRIVSIWAGGFALAVALALVCFGSGLHAKAFGDDFLYMVHPVASNPFWFFTNANPLHVYAFRPIEFAFIWCTQAWMPTDSILLHASQLALHAVAATWLAWTLLRLGFSRTVALIAGVYFLASQSAVHAVVSNDTISQQFETLFGCASLYLLHRSVSSKGEVKFRLLFASVGLFALTLLGKELGMSLVATYGLYLGYRRMRGDIRSREALIAFLPHLLVGIAYMALRKQIGLPSGSFGEKPIDFHIGLNLVVNPFLALVQVAMPFSSVDVFLAVKAREFGSLVLPALGAGLVLGLPAAGLFLSGRIRLGLELAVLFFSSICIAFLMNHISELYVYSAMPFYAAYFAIGIHSLSQKLSGMPRLSLYILVGALVLVNVFACRSKTEMMVELGERAAALGPQVAKVMAEAPRNAKIGFINPFEEVTYSVFRQEGFVTLSEWPHVYSVLNKRQDLEFGILGHNQDGVCTEATTACFSYDRDLRLSPYTKK